MRRSRLVELAPIRIGACLIIGVLCCSNLSFASTHTILQSGNDDRPMHMYKGRDAVEHLKRTNGYESFAKVISSTGLDLSFTQQPKITAVDGADSDLFGSSVALEGNTAVIGVPNDDVGLNGDQGSAYIFTR